MTTKVRLEIFEGPLDLLLHLIKKNEVNVTDIPIAAITEQYLATLDLMQSLNLDVAGEFLVMAATLIHIKSRMLLPPGEDREDEEDGSDPREELMRQLLEYQRFKEAAEELERREILKRDVFVRSPEPPQAIETVGFEEASLFDLLSALRRVLERFPKEDIHEVTLERISLQEKMQSLLDELGARGKIIFQSFFETADSRLEVVVTFLAMLELVRIRAIRISQEEGAGPIVLELAASMEDVQKRIDNDAIEGADHGA